jgi:PAS domain S-box-containing protein
VESQQVNKRVLIADDSGAMRRAIRSFLEQQPGIEICAQTARGLETLHAAIALRPDLLILDLRMPELNGIEIASLLRKNLPHSKIILFTMYQDSLHEGLANAVGAYAVVPKVDGLSGLGREVRAVLGMPKGNGENKTHYEEAEKSSQSPSELLKSALRESEEQFQAVFEQSAIGLAFVGNDGRWLRANRKFCETLGYRISELRMMTLQDTAHPGDYELDVAQAKRVEAGEIDRYSMEQRYIRKNGQIITVQSSVEAVRDDAGQLKYCVRIMGDLTGRPGSRA